MLFSPIKKLSLLVFSAFLLISTISSAQKLGQLTLDFSIHDKKTNKLVKPIFRMVSSSGELISESVATPAITTYKLVLNNKYSLSIKSDGFEEHIVEINTTVPAAKSSMRHFFGEPIVINLEASQDKAKSDYTYLSNIYYDSKLGSFSFDFSSSKRAKAEPEKQATQTNKVSPAANDKLANQKEVAKNDAAKEKAAADLAAAKARQEQEMKAQLKEREESAAAAAKAKMENLEKKESMTQEIDKQAATKVEDVVKETINEQAIPATKTDYSVSQAAKSADALRAKKRAEAAQAVIESNKRSKHEKSNPYNEVFDAIKSAPIDRSAL